MRGLRPARRRRLVLPDDSRRVLAAREGAAQGLSRWFCRARGAELKKSAIKGQETVLTRGFQEGKATHEIACS